MSTLVTVIHVVVCLFLMVTVLLQSGKGGGMGAAFGGGGGGQTVFGGSGAGGFLRKVTVTAAVAFMLTSMTLAFLASSTGTNALERYSDQQRQLADEKATADEEARKAAEGDSTAPPAPDQTGAGTPGADDGATDSTSGDSDEGIDLPGTEGAPSTEGGAPAEGATSDSPADSADSPAAGSDQPSGAAAPGSAAPGGAQPAPASSDQPAENP